MMNILNFITSELPDLKLLNTVNDQLIFSFRIGNLSDIKKISLEKLHSNKIYLADTFSFSIYLEFTGNQNKDEQLISALLENKNFLLQLFFHPKFKYDGNRPIIFISPEGNQPEQLRNFIQSFTSFFVSRGLEGLESIYFSDENIYTDKQSAVLYKFNGNTNFEDIYYELLTRKYYVANYLGIIHDKEKSINEILRLKQDVEEKFKSKLPHQYFFSQKYILLKAELPLWERKLKQSIEELENQRKYLTIIKEQDDASKINSFYYTEYEILPLWYKKFGHIIKVFQGKRTLRSLFNSNVKKYKN